MIPEEAVEAAARAMFPDNVGPAYNLALRALEAAAPHILAGVVARLDENVAALENTLVDEHDYPALCAQREALIGVMQMLRDETTP